jgi:hypothetical protein
LGRFAFGADARNDETDCRIIMQPLNSEQNGGESRGKSRAGSTGAASALLIVEEFFGYAYSMDEVLDDFPRGIPAAWPTTSVGLIPNASIGKGIASNIEISDALTTRTEVSNERPALSRLQCQRVRATATAFKRLTVSLQSELYYSLVYKAISRNLMIEAHREQFARVVGRDILANRRICKSDRRCGASAMKALLAPGKAQSVPVGHAEERPPNLVGSIRAMGEHFSREIVLSPLPLLWCGPNHRCAKTSRARDHVRLTTGHVSRQLVRARTSNQRDLYVSELAKQRELSGTGAGERTRLALLRRGMKMVSCVANGKRLGRQRLFHQKTSEHRGGGFVEPLFEESINFLF